MKRSQIVLAIACVLGATSALAAMDQIRGPIPLTSDQAFDAAVTGCLPETPQAPAKCYSVGQVALVDVRTYEEYHLQGTPGKVDSIELKDGTVFVPDQGKVTLKENVNGVLGLAYKVRGQTRHTTLPRIANVVTSPLAVNVQCATWNQETKEWDSDVRGFTRGMEDLADSGVLVAITMCNSGGRSTKCPLDIMDDAVANRFEQIYEIDRAGEGDMYVVPPEAAAVTNFTEGSHIAGLGGFQGSDYGGDYNGWVGWPNRPTKHHPILGWSEGGPNGPSVSWKDSGLPIYISDTACNL